MSPLPFAPRSLLISVEQPGDKPALRNTVLRGAIRRRSHFGLQANGLTWRVLETGSNG
jgi:hypothetical protein